MSSTNQYSGGYYQAVEAGNGAAAANTSPPGSRFSALNVLCISAVLAVVAWSQLSGTKNGVVGMSDGLTVLAKFTNDFDDACERECEAELGDECTRTQCSGKNTLKCKYMFYTDKTKTDICYAYDDIATDTCSAKFSVKCYDSQISTEETYNTTCSLTRAGKCELGPADEHALLHDHAFGNWDATMDSYKRDYDTCYAAADKNACAATGLTTAQNNTYYCSWTEMDTKSGCAVTPYTESLISYENGYSLQEKKGVVSVDQSTVFGLYWNLAEICQTAYDAGYDQEDLEDSCAATKLTSVFSNFVKCYWDQDVADTYGNEYGCTPKTSTVFGEAENPRYIYDGMVNCEDRSSSACEASGTYVTYRGITN